MVMFIDALDINGTTYLHTNIKLVSLLGLNAAVYCSTRKGISRTVILETAPRDQE